MSRTLSNSAMNSKNTSAKTCFYCEVNNYQPKLQPSRKINILSTDTKTIESLQLPNYETQVLAVETGLEVLLSTDADVLIIDETNPFILSTVDISKIIRTKNKDVVIIVLAKSDLSSAKIDNLETGADDEQVTLGSYYQFNDLQLDTTQRMCFIRNQEVILSKNEFSTLLRLVQSKGKVVTQEFLLKDI